MGADETKSTSRLVPALVTFLLDLPLALPLRSGATIEARERADDGGIPVM